VCCYDSVSFGRQVLVAGCFGVVIDEVNRFLNNGHLLKFIQTLATDQANKKIETLTRHF